MQDASANRRGNDSPRSNRGNETLPSNAAFVLRVRAPFGGEIAGLRGRVAHVASGREVRFESLAELLEFLTDALAELDSDPAD